MTDQSKNVPAIHTEVDEGDYGNLIENPPKVKFTADYKWERGGELISPQREFFVVEILRATQRWVDGLPAEGSRVLAPGEPWPNVEELNAKAPQSDWRDYFGNKVGPWQNSRVVYLMDPKTLEVITFPTPTAGGAIAVRELKKGLERARLMRGPDVYPLVTLGDVDFPTKKGGRKRRPAFKVLNYLSLGPEKPVPAQIGHTNAEPERPAKRTTPKPRQASAEFDDEIPWA